MTVKIVVKGLRGFQRNLKRQTRRVVSNVGEALVAGAEIILADARERVPVDEGDLRDSGRVDRLKRDGTVLTTGVSYGGTDDVDYARAVHEDPGGTGHKFLEKAEKARSSEVKTAIGKAAKG